MQSERVVARFRRKVRILARINHPNFVAAFDAGERDGAHFLVMEFVDGRELAALTAQFHPLPVEYVVSYISQAAAGLACAHVHQVCHRNIKPRNLLVDRQGVVKVIGLGLAKDDLHGDEIGEHRLTRPGSMLGTLDYMAPEQIADSASVDHRADIYGLGCTLYVVLTGHLLYREKSPLNKALAHRQAPIPQIRGRRPDVPDGLQQIFETMVAKAPEDRFQSMEEVIAALHGVQKELGQPPGAGTPPPAPSELEQFLAQFAQREIDANGRRDTIRKKSDGGTRTSE
jgi:serine/threonine protein kinase